MSGIQGTRNGLGEPRTCYAGSLREGVCRQRPRHTDSVRVSPSAFAHRAVERRAHARHGRAHARHGRAHARHGPVPTCGTGCHGLVRHGLQWSYIVCIGTGGLRAGPWRAGSCAATGGLYARAGSHHVVHLPHTHPYTSQHHNGGRAPTMSPPPPGGLSPGRISACGAGRRGSRRRPRRAGRRPRCPPAGPGGTPAHRSGCTVTGTPGTGARDCLVHLVHLPTAHTPSPPSAHSATACTTLGLGPPGHRHWAARGPPGHSP
jgi:hypothetical protein